MRLSLDARSDALPMVGYEILLTLSHLFAVKWPVVSLKLNNVFKIPIRSKRVKLTETERSKLWWRSWTKQQGTGTMKARIAHDQGVHYISRVDVH